MHSTSSVIDLQDLQNQDDDPFSDEPLHQISISDHKSASGMSTNSPSCHKISDDLTTYSPLPQHVSEPPQIVIMSYQYLPATPSLMPLLL